MVIDLSPGGHSTRVLFPGHHENGMHDRAVILSASAKVGDPRSRGALTRRSAHTLPAS